MNIRILICLCVYMRVKDRERDGEMLLLKNVFE